LDADGARDVDAPVRVNAAATSVAPSAREFRIHSTSDLAADEFDPAYKEYVAPTTSPGSLAADEAPSVPVRDDSAMAPPPVSAAASVKPPPWAKQDDLVQQRRAFHHGQPPTGPLLRRYNFFTALANIFLFLFMPWFANDEGSFSGWFEVSNKAGWSVGMQTSPRFMLVLCAALLVLAGLVALSQARVFPIIEAVVGLFYLGTVIAWIIEAVRNSIADGVWALGFPALLLVVLPTWIALRND
jgi:hypothetical protein